MRRSDRITVHICGSYAITVSQVQLREIYSSGKSQCAGVVRN